MRALKLKEGMSVIEAVDILSSLSELESSSLSREKSFESSDALHPERWLDEVRKVESEELLKGAFHSIHQYLKQTLDKDSHILRDPEIQKSVVAILKITQDAIEKAVKFTSLFNSKLTDVSEYQEMQGYVHKFILPHLSKADIKKVWRAGLGIHEEELADVTKKEIGDLAIGDLADIKEDMHYEFFYMKNENSKPFYGLDCIRRLKLLYDATLVDNQIDENLVKIKLLEAKDFQQRAIDILNGISHLTEEFYKESSKIKGLGLASSLKKALMALMLTASPRNLPGKSDSAKSAAEHFIDFRYYLREALTSIEYKEGSSSTRRSYNQNFVAIAHKLCFSYFLSVSLQKEMVAFLRSLIKKEGKDSSLPTLLTSEDEALRDVLQKTSTGPLKKVVNAFLRGEVDLGWDPLAQRNAPSHIFSVFTDDTEIDVLRMAAPLKQTSINKAEVVEEFEVFLTGCLLPRKDKMLFIDLQDATSLDEHARTECLQSFGEKEEVKKTLSILRLAKQTDFYFQKDVYKEQDKASNFIKTLKEQITGGSVSGFAFPKEFASKAILEFITKASSFVHEAFFEDKKSLSLREKQDFIEIIYFLISLKAIEIIQPRYMAYLSKDGLDTAVSANACFFFCLKSLLGQDPSTEKDKDFFLYLLYAPILFLRERTIHKEDLLRSAHLMETFQEGILKRGDKIAKGFKSLYKKDHFKSVEIKEGD